MLELPIIPGRWAYGGIQRRLADKHRVTLIPKRLLAGVIFETENTLDGIHLSAKGHRAMVEELAPWPGATAKQP